LCETQLPHYKVISDQHKIMCHLDLETLNSMKPVIRMK
jgi:hypothetical protein